MRLQNTLGHVLDLRVVSYQYPGRTDGDWDANWLIVEGNMVGPDGTWDFRDPCLTTGELVDLTAFFATAAERKEPAEGELTFTEPNLAFRWITDGVAATIRVLFELEARPPWTRPARVRSEDVFLDFQPTGDELRAAAESLRADLDRFPPRGDWADRGGRFS